MLNKNGKTEYPCIVPDIRGKTSNLSPFNMLLAVGFYSCILLDWESSLLLLICQDILLRIVERSPKVLHNIAALASILCHQVAYVSFKLTLSTSWKCMACPR